MERVLEPEAMDTPEEAQGYDSMDHTEPNESFLKRLLELGASGRMLDIGTGPGHIPLLVCRRLSNAEVVGVDLSENMLDLARRHLAASAYKDRIEFKKADAKGLPFADHEFDVVYSNTILHHIPDPRPFITEAWRVLRTGGVFCIRDLFRPDSPERRDELVELYAAEEEPYQKELFRASLHAAFAPEELRDIVADCGLQENLEIVLDSDRHMTLQSKPA